MPPFDPTQPPQDPNQPGQPGNQPMQKPQMDKLKFEDVFDVNEIQDKMGKIFRVSKVIESEEKKSAEIHLKYLKIVETAERHKHTLLVNEKKAMLKMLDEEMRIQKNIAMGGVPAGAVRIAAGTKVEQEFAAKKQNVEAAYKPQIASQNLRAIVSEGAGIWGDMNGKLSGFIGLLPKLGTAMGAMSSLVTGLLAVFKLGTERLADLTKLQAQLRAGGMGLNESARSVGAAQKAFSILGQDMETLGQSTDDVNRLVSEFSKAPALLDELTQKGGPEAWKTIRNAMGEFGVDAETTANMLSTASNKQNMSMKEAGREFVNVAKVAKLSGMNFKDAFNSLLNFNSDMRNLTFNTDEARKVFTAAALTLRSLSDLKLSPEEVQKFISALTGSLGSMTVEKITGVLSFVKGHMPTDKEVSEGLGIDTIVKAINKMMGGQATGEGSLVKISASMQSLGLSLGDHPAQTAKAMQAVLVAFQRDHGANLKKVMDDNLANQMTADEKHAKEAADAMQKAQAAGFEAQKQMVPPLNKLATSLGTFATKFVDNFMPAFSGFASNFDKFVKATTFQSVRNAGHDVMREAGRMSGLDNQHYRSTVEANMDKSARMRERKALASMLLKSMTGL